MLVEVVVKNFYSFRDETVFSMVASTIPEHPATVSEQGDLTLSKVSAIYGANASGKSNLLRAVNVIRAGLFGEKGDWLEEMEPFHLDAQTELQDSCLEMSFLLEGELYRYGFHANKQAVTEEYLYLETTETKQIFHHTDSRSQLAFKDQIQDYPAIQRWFQAMQVILHTQNVERTVSKARLHLEKYKHNLLTLIQVADPSIHDVEMKDGEFYVIKLKKQADGTFEPIRQGFLFQDVESMGTVKLLALAGPIIEALEQGSLLLVDEMDQSFHTLMTRYVLELFRGEFNKKGAQLIFSTHDISNLRSELFRRDQIWFVEKKREGNSELVSLVEYQFDDTERKNTFDFYRNYLNGKYGAVPFVPPADWWVDNGEA